MTTLIPQVHHFTCPLGGQKVSGVGLSNGRCHLSGHSAVTRSSRFRAADDHKGVKKGAYKSSRHSTRRVITFAVRVDAHQRPNPRRRSYR